MTSELVTCAVAFFRSRGKNVVTEKEFLMGMSMNMRWMPYGDAERLLAAFVDADLVEKDGEYIRPKIDLNSVDVPVSYRPPAELIDGLKAAPTSPSNASAPVADAGSESPSSEISGNAAASSAAAEEDVFQILMSKAVGMGMDRKEFLSSSRTIQKKMNIEVEVAALMVLRDNGADVASLIDKVHDAVLRK